jgi:hypothetical protein
MAKYAMLKKFVSFPNFQFRPAAALPNAPRLQGWKYCPWRVYPGARETLEVVLAD